MKLFSCTLVIFFGIGQAVAQVDEVMLADTVVFITEAINDLESTRINQEIYRLNFDDCNLELTVSDKNAKEENWIIEEFWLPDIDENRTQLMYSDEKGEWAIRLVSIDKARKFKRSSNFSTGRTYEVHIYGAKKEPLISIGQALFYAIQSCKGLDRFKEGR